MKTLILCVDRDDDIGTKAGVATPIIGRRRIVEAATKLGVADPEDSDTNALFAAAHLYDKELLTAETDGRQLEVAAITGHHRMGLRGDRKLAAELQEVLELSRVDEVILVSDGAEDEQILPILTSHVKVAHVHRSIVKQAPRLEGFYYVLTRIMNDKKMAQRYILPLGLVLLVWSLAYLLQIVTYAWGITLGIIGTWLIVQANHWEDNLSKFFSDLREGLRSGKIAILANIVMVVLLVVGAAQAWAALPSDASGWTLRGLFFLQEYLLYVISAFLIRTAGLLFDAWFSKRTSVLRHWTAAFTWIAFGFIGSVVLDLAAAIMQQAPIDRLLTFDFIVRLLAGLAVAMGGILLGRYVRGFLEENGPRA